VEESRGSDKRCVLKQKGLEKLKKALASVFHEENPSDQKVADSYGVNRETVGKIRNGNAQTPVTRNSIEKLFSPLNLDLDQEDYQQLPLSSKNTRSQKSKAPNPFGDVGAVSDPVRFFGRQALLRQLFEEIEKGCNRSLVGESSAGKSSILKMICQLGAEKVNRPREKFIYLDMRRVLDGQSFFEELCHELQIASAPQIYREAKRRGGQYVLCLDEIDQLVDTTRFPVNHRDLLAGWSGGTDEPFTLVIASQRPLQDLFPDSPLRSSPLAGICPTLEVKPFDLVEVTEFITHRLQKTGVIFEPEQVNDLWKESGGLPGRLQQLAAELYRQQQE